MNVIARRSLKDRLDKIDRETVSKGGKAVVELWLLEKHTMWRKGREVRRAYPELENRPKGGRGVSGGFRELERLTGRQAETISKWVKIFDAHEDEKEFIAWAKEESVLALKKWEASLLPAHATLTETQVLLPEVSSYGGYNVIVIDPPWDMEKIERDVRPNQYGFDYPTMSEEELAVFGVSGIAADDCHLFCWTTHKFLPSAFRLLEAWGFRYVLTMVWHKPGGYQPFGLPQYNCEFCLYARRGSPEFIDTKAFFTCFEAPRREHSRKPNEFYDVVRRVTDGKRIDVFSREKRDGFDQFGNETERFAA